jgi:hypothetical protein
VLPGETAAGLAPICDRAMQLDPARRYPSVAALRLEILAFLANRDSARNAERGRLLADDLRTALGSGRNRRDALELYEAARFAYREAVRIWPDNSTAKQGLSELVALFAEHELRRDARVAASLLESIPDAPVTLIGRVNRAVESDDRARELNAKIAADLDPSVGRMIRTVLLIIAGVTWTCSPIVSEYVGEMSHRRFIAGSLVPLPLVFLAVLSIPALRSTLFNRRIFGLLAGVMVGRSLLFLAAWRLGIDVQAARALDIGLSLTVSTVLAITVDARFWPMTSALFLGAAVAVARPDLTSFAASGAYLLTTLNLGLIWRRLDKAQAAGRGGFAHGNAVRSRERHAAR